MRKLLVLFMAIALVMSPILPTQSFATVASTTNRIIYSGNNSTTVFPYAFKIFADTDLVITVVTTATGAEETQTITTDYTVSGAGDASGGNVTMIIAPTTTEDLVVRRVLPMTQGTDLVDNTSFSLEVLEEGYDRDIMIAQQLQEEIDRCIQAGEASTLDLSMPSPVAGGMIGYNSDATALTTYTTIESQQLVTATGSSAQRTLADRFAEVVNVKDFEAVGNGSADDTIAINAALAYAGGVNKACYLPAGTYKVTGKITIPANVSVFGDGMEETIIDGSTITTGLYPEGLIYCEGGGTTALPALAAAITAGDRTITFASAPAISPGDMMMIKDNTAGSWRDTAEKGEYAVVQDVTGAVVTLMGSTIDSYADTCNGYNVDTTTMTLRDFKVLGNTSGDSIETHQIKIKYGRNVVLERIKLVDPNADGIELQNHLGGAIRSCYIVKSRIDGALINSGGIGLSSCQSTVVSDCVVDSDWYGIGGGGGDIINRYNIIRNCWVQAPQTSSLDFHTGNAYCTYEGNVVFGSIQCGGSNNIFRNNIVYGANSGDNILFNYVQQKSMGLVVEGNKFYHKGTSYLIESAAAADIDSQTDVDGILVFRNNYVEWDYAGSRTLIYLINQGSTATNKIHIEGNKVVNKQAASSCRLMNITAASGSDWNEVVIRDNDLYECGIGVVKNVQDIIVEGNSVRQPTDATSPGDFYSTGGIVIVKNNLFQGGKDQILITKTTTNATEVEFKNNSLIGLAPSENIPVLISNADNVVCSGNTAGDTADASQTNPIYFSTIGSLWEENNVWIGTGPPKYATVTTANAAILTIANDAAASFTPPNVPVGVITVMSDNATNFSGIVMFRAVAGGAETVSIGAGADLEVATGTLAGTTGTDVKVTVSAHTDGKIYIENRSGGSLDISYRITAGLK